ncbi:hypothetical protein GCM10007868_23240 [Gluconobacter frateurii]|nr:hypothetical protein GCM10007868_23240 [Gluconobacter frateurii]
MDRAAINECQGNVAAATKGRRGLQTSDSATENNDTSCSRHGQFPLTGRPPIGLMTVLTAAEELHNPRSRSRVDRFSCDRTR